MKIKFSDIILAGVVAVGGYFAYKYFTAKKTVSDAISPIVNIFQQTPADAVGQTGQLLYNAAVESGQEVIGGTGFELPAPMGEEKPAEVTAAETFIDFTTGILKANPITAPVTPIVGAVLDYTSDVIKSSYVKALPPTEYTTPTIPKYTTDYEQEILGSTAPAIVKAKILAGKIT